MSAGGCYGAPAARMASRRGGLSGGGYWCASPVHDLRCHTHDVRLSCCAISQSRCFVCPVHVWVVNIRVLASCLGIVQDPQVDQSDRAAESAH